MRIKKMILVLAICGSFGFPVRAGGPDLELTACYHEELREEVLCGTLTVMENRQVRKGAKIDINFIILPARAENPRPDPVFVFDGGPGAGAASWPSAWARYSDRVRDQRDIVLVDQRGTGQSNPLPCRRLGDPQSAQTYLQEMYSDEYVDECLQALRNHADLHHYHTTVAMGDYDELRDALGYDQINILGGSYGSYFGIIFMKMYPQRVRSACLFSVSLPHLLYPANLAQDTETALQQLLSDVAADPNAAADYPDLSAQLDRVLLRLKYRRARVKIVNPINKLNQTVNFTHYNFITGLRAMLYSTSASRWIPAFIHWADNGHYQPIAEYTVDYNYYIDHYLMDGMFLCVTCAESIPYIDFDEARERAQGTMMGTYRLNQQKSACTRWVRAEIPSDFHQLVYQDIPLLLLNGENDPTTPPFNAEILSRYHPESRVVIVPHAGHGIGMVMEDCLDNLFARFYEQGAAEGLDFSCVYQYQRPPFVSWRNYEDNEQGVNLRRIRREILRLPPVTGSPRVPDRPREK